MKKKNHTLSYYVYVLQCCMLFLSLSPFSHSRTKRKGWTFVLRGRQLTWFFFSPVCPCPCYTTYASVYTTYSNSCNKFCRERTDGRMCVNCSITLASQFLWVLRTKQNKRKPKEKKKNFFLFVFIVVVIVVIISLLSTGPLSSNRRFPQN